MQPTAINILDQLLGTPEVSTGINPSIPGEQTSDGLLFKEVLGRLGVSFDPSKVISEHGEQTAALPNTDVFADLMNAEELPETIDVNRPEITFNNLSALLPMPLGEQQQAAFDVTSLLPSFAGTHRAILPQGGPQQPSPLVDNFVSRLAANPQWQQLQNWQPLNTEPATYKILDSSIANNRVEMTVVGVDEGSEPIKISVPSQMLQALQTRGHSRRVSLDSTQISTNPRVSGWGEQTTEAASTVSSRRHLADLMQSLRLKSLEVMEQQPTARAHQPGADVAVRFTAEYMGRQVSLEQKYPRQEIRARIATATGGLQNNQTVNGTVEPQMLQSARTGENALDGIHSTERDDRSHARPVAVPSKIQLTRQVFDLTERLLNGKTNISDMSLVNDKLSADGLKAMPKASLDATPVRFTLPEQLETTGKPINQTLMLKIEPEHLGPARLHLMMRHEALTARVYVDSPAAKAVVESSLDQLGDQLHRAGIQVGKIEVSISGGGAKNEFLDRRPAWANQIKSKPRYFDDEVSIEQAASAMTFAGHAGAQYVRESGVNVLA